MSEPIRLADSIRRPDAEIAAEVKAKVFEKLDDVCAIMNAARDAGLTVTWNIGTDGKGRAVIVNVMIVKEF